MSKKNIQILQVSTTKLSLFIKEKTEIQGTLRLDYA